MRPLLSWILIVSHYFEIVSRINEIIYSFKKFFLPEWRNWASVWERLYLSGLKYRLNVLLISVIKLTADNSTSAELYKGVWESLFLQKKSVHC